MKQQLLEQEVAHLRKIIEAERINNVRLIEERDRLRSELREALHEKAELEYRLDSLSH